MVGKVFLIGAGPGAPDLISVLGRERLSRADLVLYDALVHPDLLDHCKPGAEKQFVGKRAGRPSERQQRINATMIEAARNGRLVARLKGGDPFLFGRGSEEAEVLAEAGIDFEVIPGIPSPIAVAAYAGISLSHRELASSIAFLTATESPEKDRSSHDWKKLATATQTLVIFMGRRRLDSLMRLLIEHGRTPNTPAAVVQSASLPSQRVITGTVGDIADKATAANIGTPALTIVGDVVRLREHLGWFEKKPLFGKRVLVTRPAGQARSLSQLLRDEGADPIAAPTVVICPPTDSGPLTESVRNAGSYDWILFTSRNGVDAFFDELARQGADARRFGSASVCAIGPATAEALRAHGVRADIVPDEYRGEAVADVVQSMSGTLAGKRILLPRAAIAREALPRMLREALATVDVVEAYRSTFPDEDAQQRIRDLIEQRKIDIVTLTASSTVQNLATILGPRAKDLLDPLTIASIGPITTETAEKLGLRVDVTATTYTNEGLVSALAVDAARR